MNASPSAGKFRSPNVVSESGRIQVLQPSTPQNPRDAELVVQALVTGALRDTSVSISSTTGSGPGDDTGEWKKLFQGLA